MGPLNTRQHLKLEGISISWAKVWDDRQAYGPIRGQLSIPMPHVFAVRVTWGPACEHTQSRVAVGSPITSQNWTIPGVALPACHLPHEMALRYKLRLTLGSLHSADPISCPIGQDEVLIACQKLYFSAPGKELTTEAYSWHIRSWSAMKSERATLRELRGLSVSSIPSICSYLRGKISTTSVTVWQGINNAWCYYLTVSWCDVGWQWRTRPEGGQTRFKH